MSLATAALLVAIAGASATQARARHRPRRPPAVRSLRAPRGIHVSIRLTAHGIPHIIAGDYRSLGFGLGWSEAHDVLCPLADAFVTVDAQRSRYFGPDGSYSLAYLNGTTPNNLQSDFFFAKIIKQGTVERLLDPRTPGSPAAPTRAMVSGFAQGYDAALRAEHAPAGITDPACKGQPWVHPIAAIDVWRRLYAAALLASSEYAMSGIVSASPPGAGLLSGLAVQARQRRALALVRGRLDRALTGAGSNAIALGRQATRDGHGIMLGNPHVPWYGAYRFYEFQLTLPGRMDVAGSSFLGIPAVLNGFTRGLAWSNTDWTAREFVPYQLQLVPGSPTSYMVDGQVKQMRQTTVTVAVKNADGTVGTEAHTFYDTEYGPVLTSIAGLPIFPWTPTTAYAIFDANAENLGRVTDYFFGLDRAQSVAQLDAVARRYQGLPWAQTLAADSRGNVYFTTIGSIPNIDSRRYVSCETPLGQALVKQAALPVLDGSTSACAPGQAPGAAAPGILPPSQEPSLIRQDYVENSNDSPWLVNARHLITGFSPIIGPQAQPQLFRTRFGIKSVEDRLDGRDGPVRTFTPQMLMNLMFNDDDYEAQLWLSDAETMCQEHPTMIGSNGPVDVAAACSALHDYDMHADLGSRGYLLWRRFSERIWLNGESTNPWADSFNPADPVNTPAKLNTNDSGVQKSFADAVTDLEGAHIPFDAPLGQYAYVVRNGRRIPLHGGSGVGLFNVIFDPWDPHAGYPDVEGGSTYIEVVRVTGGCPDAHTLLTHSQSTDPTSPYYADQTWMYSRKQWITFPFCERAILRSRGLQITNFGGGYPRHRHHRRRSVVHHRRRHRSSLIDPS